MKRFDGRRLWLRWVAANALGEMFGLGLTFALAAALFARLPHRQGAGIVLVSFLVSAGSGAIEAAIVGCAQWWAMRAYFPQVTLRVWGVATLAGALAAYVLGYLPSTLMSLGEQAAQSPPPPVAEPPQWLTLLLAAGLGLVAGAVLSFAQWLALRKQVGRAGWWLPANMLAWLVGMPLIFWGIDLAQRAGSLGWAVPVMAGVLLLAGAVVGAIHGAFLVWIAQKNAAVL